MVLPEKMESVNENGNTQNGAEAPVPPKPTVRKDFYQTESDFILNIMAKNVDPSTVVANYTPEELEVTAKLPDGQTYELKEKVFAKIRPEHCSYNVTKTKIEIRLRKDAASTWPALEAAVQKKEVLPQYPSSSKHKKDWGKVEKAIAKEVEDQADVNSLFAKIFESGDENTKRAMMKSMQESGGTVLSTNWNEVGSKKVDCSPPDGMEWKKWD